MPSVIVKMTDHEKKTPSSLGYRGRVRSFVAGVSKKRGAWGGGGVKSSVKGGRSSRRGGESFGPGCPGGCCGGGEGGTVQAKDDWQQFLSFWFLGNRKMT